MPRRLPYGWLVGVGGGLLVAAVHRVDSDAGQVLLVVTAAGGVLGGLRPLGWWLGAHFQGVHATPAPTTTAARPAVSTPPTTMSARPRDFDPRPW